MSQRISDSFLAASKAGRKVLIPFITAGDPHPDWNVAVMHALVDAGADLIELGRAVFRPDGRWYRHTIGQ